MSKFIVTGATGYIGSHLCRQLVSEGHKVFIVAREDSKITNIEDIIQKVVLFKYNKNIESLVKFFNLVKPDCVFHIASVIISEHTQQDIETLINSNIKFGTEILEAMRLTNTKNIINTGTSLQHDKNELYNPSCLYAATKQAFEDILKYYTNTYQFNCITLKLFNVYGGHDTSNKIINQLNCSCLTKQELVLSEGNQKIDLIHIEDVVRAYLSAWQLLKQNSYSEYQDYGVCTGRRVTLRELISLYEKVNLVQLNINFDKKTLRLREVMEPWSLYKLLPNWAYAIPLEEGLKRAFANK